MRGEQGGAGAWEGHRGGGCPGDDQVPQPRSSGGAGDGRPLVLSLSPCQPRMPGLSFWNIPQVSLTEWL